MSKSGSPINKENPPNVVGLIPARAGSKGIPGKNLTLVAGKPLLQYTCEAALSSESLGSVILSTDSEEISEVGRSFGVETPFIRPPELAADDTPMLDVMLHALDWLEANGSRPEALVLLQPTSPLRSSADIDEAITIFLTNEAATVVSVVEIPHNFTPTSAFRVEDGRIVQPTEPSTPTRRQDKERFFARNGPAILAASPATLRAGHLYGDPTFTYGMPKDRSYDIDEPTDLFVVECLLSHRSR